MISFTLIALIATAAATFYFWLKHNFSYWRRKGIPYVEPTLLLGNTTEALLMKNSFGLHLSTVYNDPQMVDEAVVGIYSLNKPGLVIRDPELIKAVLIKDFNKFYNRYGRSDPHGDTLGSNNLFFVRSPHWKDIRSKISPVFTSGKIRQMYPLMLEVANELEIHLASHHKGRDSFATEVKEICALFTTDLIANIAFGLRANSLRDPNAEFRAQGRKMFLFTLSRSFEFFIAFFMPAWVSFFRVKMFGDEFSKFLRSTISYVISERERTGLARNDLIDILVALKKEAESSPEGYFAKDHDFLVAQAAVFLTAGFETSSSTMAFALYELAKHPEMQERLRKEIHEAFVEGQGTISYDKLMSLEYLGMVVDEVLRMYPVLPFLDREHVKPKGDTPFTLKPYYDYTLEDEMPVFIPVYAIQRDPKYWTNPNKFDPERFSPENKKNINPITYIPFGTGPHNCIGSRIGLLQSKIGLVHLLKNYNVTTCKQTISEMKFDPKALVLQCEEGIILNFVNDKLYDNTVST